MHVDRYSIHSKTAQDKSCHCEAVRGVYDVVYQLKLLSLTPNHPTHAPHAIRHIHNVAAIKNRRAEVVQERNEGLTASGEGAESWDAKHVVRRGLTLSPRAQCPPLAPICRRR